MRRAEKAPQLMRAALGRKAFRLGALLRHRSAVRCLLLVGLAPAGFACQPVLGDCHYVELAKQPGLVLTDERPNSGECYRFRGSLPREYALKRSGYALYFRTGDRWYPELVVRARDSAGAVLPLSSKQLRELDHENWEPRAFRNFDYFVPIHTDYRRAEDDRVVYPDTVHVIIPDRGGGRLGQEAIRLNLRKARHFSWDAL